MNRPGPTAPNPPGPGPGLAWLVGSTRNRLLAGLLVALLVSGALLTLTAVSIGRQSVRHAQENDARRLATLFEASLHNAMLQRDLAGLGHLLQTLGDAPGVARAGLLDIRGEVRFASDPAWLATTHTDRLAGLCLSAARPGQATAQIQWRPGTSGPALHLAYPIANQARCAACHGPASAQPFNGVLLIEFQPEHTLSPPQGQTPALLLVGLGALTLFGLLMAWTLTRLITRPLAALTGAADRLAAGDTQARAALSGQDEFARVGRHFDTMAERLDHSMGRLRSQQAFLQQLIDALPDPVLVIGADHRIRLANHAYRQIIGQPRDRVAGACCHRIGRALDQPCPATLVHCPLAELTGANPPRSLRTVMTLRHADGTDIPVEIEAAPLPVDGLPGVVEVMRPLDRSIRFSQEQRLATIGLLANGVAHEIHNPLASIRLALQASLRGLQTDTITREELVDYLELVDDQIDRAVLATDRLMRMSHPPGEQPSPVPLAPAVDDVLALLREECRQRRVTTHVELAPATVQVLADHAGLRQVLVNLVHNALHAMPEGGEIHIRRVESADGRHQVLSVRDTGTGIPDADLPRIFLPFFSRRADGQSGMGLGLAICKSLMDHFGGDISVRSEGCAGTTFTLTLRTAPPTATAPEP